LFEGGEKTDLFMAMTSREKILVQVQVEPCHGYTLEPKLLRKVLENYV
jgi:hypothetical protein